MPLFSFPKTLHQTQSPLSGKIKVVQVGKERRLIVGGLIQSINFDAPDVNERIWGKIATEIENWKLRAQRQIENCLILGLGGGTVAHLLTQRFGSFPIDGVEIDPVVVAIGKKYFDLGKLSQLKIINADAVKLIKNRKFEQLRFRHYSLIIVDLYCGSQYPAGATKDSFFEGLKEIGGGLLVFNRVGNKKDNTLFEARLQRHWEAINKTIVPSKFGGKNIIYVVSSPKLSKPRATGRR